MPSDAASTVTMREFFAAGARALVTAQLALDEQAEEMPSAAFAYSSCRLRFPAAADCTGRRTASDRAVVSLSPANRAAAQVTMSIRRLPSPRKPVVETTDEPH
jgi:hypothetical protein